MTKRKHCYGESTSNVAGWQEDGHYVQIGSYTCYCGSHAGDESCEVPVSVIEAVRVADDKARDECGVLGLSTPHPKGAFYAFPDVSACYRAGRQGSVELAEYLLEEAGVATVPGLAFGADDHLRISFACSDDALETGLERLAAALAR